VLAGIYGTNPAGGGYQGISPSILFAHKDCNIAVGGGGILSGMSPKGFFDVDGAEQLISAAQQFKVKPPGSTSIHHDETGFFRYVYETEEAVLDGIRDYMTDMPAYAPKFFRVATPKAPLYPAEDLYHLLPFNQKRAYSFDQILARLVDGSEHLEFQPDRGPEIYTGLCKMDGYLVGMIGNRQGFLKPDYPEYADYPGIGGKLYRQGLIKMNEFVTLCGRDRIPIVWFQDTSGIDVGDIAEKAELLGLGQSLIYSIQQTDVPQMLIVRRSGRPRGRRTRSGPPASGARRRSGSCGCHREPPPPGSGTDRPYPLPTALSTASLAVQKRKKLICRSPSTSRHSSSLATLPSKASLTGRIVSRSIPTGSGAATPPTMSDLWVTTSGRRLPEGGALLVFGKGVQMEAAFFA
jgi:hypothetical protein